MKKCTLVFAILAIFILPLNGITQDNGFDPGLLVADESFGDYEAFGDAEGVQKFLEIRGSLLADKNVDFLKKLKEPADITLKNQLEDPNANLGRLRTAAELIFDAAQHAKINPQVILATLQKEQSLIDGTFSTEKLLQRHLDRAMGFACPDTGGCGDLFLGFYFQLFGNVDNEGNRYLGSAKSLSKSFYTESDGVRIGRGPMIDANGSTFSSSPKIRTSRVGDTITVDNTQGPPNNAPSQQTFVLKNAATTALYRYTPHVYNGNYNFWKFYHQWFKYPNGSLIKLTSGGEVYYIDNGTKRPVSGSVMVQRGLDVTKSHVLSQREFDEYPLAKPLPPADGSLIAPSSGNVKYLVENNQLHKISDFIIAQRGLNSAQTIYLPDFEVNGYEVGVPALPNNGTLIRNTSQDVVYLVQDQTLRPVSGFVFNQRGYKFSNVVIAADLEMVEFPKGTTLPPLDGTLVKSAGSPLVYYVALGQKYPVPGFVFKLRGYKFSSVVTLGQDEIDNLILTNHLAPADGTLLKSKDSSTVYLVEAENLHYITGFLFGYYKYKFSDIKEVTSAELSLITQNSPLYLPDGTLIKIVNDGTVYWLEGGNKLPLTYQAFTARHYKFSSVIEIPQSEADRYPTGAVISE